MPRGSRRDRITRVADDFAGHLAEHLQNASFLTKEAIPRRLHWISFAPFALGRFRPFHSPEGLTAANKVAANRLTVPL